MRETPDTLPYGKYLPDVYRFAFLMTGNADTAADVLRHTVRQAARGCLHDIRDPLRAKRWLFAEARTLCAHPPPAAPRADVPLTSVPGPADAAEPDASPAPLAAVPAEDVPAATDDPPRQLALLFADLAEDERTALILFYLFLFDPAELAELLEIKPADLGPLLLRGRIELQRHGVRYENLFAAATDAPPAEAIPHAEAPPFPSPMAAAASDKLLASLACCRPDAQPQGDRRLRDALQRMEADPALKDAFARQAEFDGRMAALVRGLPLPETFDTEIDAGLRDAGQGAPKSKWRGILRQPVFWAVMLAGAFLVAYAAYTVYAHMTGFTGDETVRQIIETSRTGPHADHLEPINTECSQLGDKLFVQYTLEDYMVPAVFAHDQAFGYRVFAKNDSLVAQVKVRDGGHEMTFLVFRADQQGVNIHPPGRWKFLDGDGWTAAAAVRHHIGFVAIAPGDGADLRATLEKAEGEKRKAEGKTPAQP